MNKYDISDLSKLIKSAREKALKGSYHESYDLYKECFEIVQTKVKLATDSNLREQWFKTGQNIKQELLEVKEIMECCYTFRMEKKEEPKINNNMILRDYLDHGVGYNANNRKLNNENDQFKRMYSNDDQDRGANDRKKEEDNLEKKRFERFGGKVPFECHNKNNSEEKHTEINNQPPKVSQKNSDNYNLRKNYSNINVGKKPINYLDVEKKRNYEKPWKGDDKEKDNKDKKKDKNDKEKEKKSDKR